MDRWLAVLMAALVLATGCLGEDAADDSTTPDDGTPDNDSMGTAPDDINASETVSGLDPGNTVTGEPCSNPEACTEYPFTVEARSEMQATLTWENQNSDFDLYLYEGDQQVAMSAGPPPSTEESISASLSPGDYRLVVVAWAVVQDTYTLDATFELA